MYTDGIIFDVDGTLWDSTPIVAEAWTQAVLECGIKDRIVTAGELKQLFGKTMSVIAASLFPEASKEVQEIILEKCCVYEEEALEENQQDICYPDVREVIKQLAKTYDLYIVSNCQCGYIEQFLRKTQLEAYIKDIECFGNTGKNKGESTSLYRRYQRGLRRLQRSRRAVYLCFLWIWKRYRICSKDRGNERSADAVFRAVTPHESHVRSTESHNLTI